MNGRETKIGLVGFLIGTFFGWVVISVMIGILGVSAWTIGYAIGYLLPIIVFALIVYWFVNHFKNRHDYNEWKRSRETRK